MEIIFIALRGIGNTLLLTPALKNIRKNMKEAKISVIVQDYTAKQILDGSPDFDELILFPKESYFKKISLILSLRKRKFDVSITAFPSNRIQYNLFSFLIGAKKKITHKYDVGQFRTLSFLCNTKVPAIPGIHDVDQNLALLRPLGIMGTSLEKTYIQVCSNDLAYANKFFMKSGIDENDLVIGIHLSINTKEPYKRWAKENIKNFADFAGELVERFHSKIIFFAGPDEIDTVNEINQMAEVRIIMSTNKSIKQTVAIIKRCNLFINTDSGLGHIAAAMDCPTITIFGPSDPRRASPYGNYGIAIENDPSCSRCYKYPFFQTDNKIKCNNFKCMKIINLNEVLKNIEYMINAGQLNIRSNLNFSAVGCCVG